MRILIAHSNFSQSNILKQPWRFSYELSCHLAELGHKISILTDANPQGVRNVKNLEIKSLPTEYLRFKLGQNSVVKDYDIVFYVGNSLSGIYLRRWNNLLPKPKLALYISSAHYTIHELSALSPRELRSNWIHLMFSIPPFSHSVRLLNNPVISSIIVPNNTLRRRLIKFGVNRSKITVFPLPFDPSESIYETYDDREIRKKLALPIEEFIITYLGPPLTIRGTDTLIRVTHLLNRWLKGFRFLLLLRVDSGEEAKEEIFLRSLIRKLNTSSRFFVASGVLSRERVKEYIHASDVIALPFKIVQSEPPITLLESMALGKPVITTKTCGLPELIGTDRGVLVEPNNPKDLALAIYKLAQDPDRRMRIGQKAREFILKMPDWNSVVSLYERLFEDLVGQGK